MYRHTLFALLLCILTAGPSLAQDPPYVIPEFTFYRMDNTPFTRNDLSKTSNIVFVFFSTTCHHCQDETRAMGEHFENFNQSTLYFISREGKAEIQKFMEVYGKALKGKANVQVLRDPQSAFVLKFRSEERRVGQECVSTLRTRWSR